MYAVNASSKGTILWKTQLNTPTGSLDGGIPLGVLGTPTIDLKAQRLYVASADATQGWQVFALDITTGRILPGWPLNINGTTLAPINENGPALWSGTTQQSQRGGLNLSPDGRLLYIPFGAYNDLSTGWMVAVDTATPTLASAFSGAPSTTVFANAGMWSSGGPAVDAQGNVYSTTGNGSTDKTNAPGYWGQSVLMWGPGTPLKLVGTYTPWNYCQMDLDDADLSGGAPIVLPDVGGGTPNLITFGGKQGNQYLVDRDRMPGSLVSRAPCGSGFAPGRFAHAAGRPAAIRTTGSTEYFRAIFGSGRQYRLCERALDRCLLSRRGWKQLPVRDGVEQGVGELGGDRAALCRQAADRYRAGTTGLPGC